MKGILRYNPSKIFHWKQAHPDAMLNTDRRAPRDEQPKSNSPRSDLIA
jgi:hypothetical protein